MTVLCRRVVPAVLLALSGHAFAQSYPLPTFAGAAITARADPTGVSDAGTALQAAATQAAAAGVSVHVPPGLYKLTGSFTPPANQVWDYEGTTFTGGGAINQSGDWSPMWSHLAHSWVQTSNEPVNLYSTYTSLIARVSGATANYEKGAGYDEMLSYDPSSYTQIGTNGGVPTWSANYTLDAVGRQSAGAIGSGNMTGRAWGALLAASTQPSSDGLLTGLEIDVNNNGGVDQPYFDQPNDKVGINVVASGTSGTTAYTVGRGGTAKWHTGLGLRQDTISDYAIRVLASNSLTNNTYTLTPAGDETANSVSVNAGTVTSNTSNLAFNTAGGTQANVANTASAVDYISMSGAAAGGSPFIVPAGSDTNISLLLGKKGTGSIIANGPLVSTALTVSGTNSIVVNTSGTGSPPTIKAVGGDTNLALSLAGAGTSGVLHGAFIRTADPTTTDIPAGYCADWNNTTAVTFKHVCNFGGTLRSVSMS